MAKHKASIRSLGSVIGVIGFALLLAGCQNNGSEEVLIPEEAPFGYEMVNRAPAASTYEYDYSNVSSVIPQPEQETSRTIQWINADVLPHSELMMLSTLQGNVNRIQPSMYIVHDELVEGSAGFNASQFWFDQLDEQYTGDEAFTKVEYTDPYQMVVDNQDKFQGVVIYHERLTDGAMASRDAYQSRYADMALLNLTLMLSGQYEAIALNRMQYTILKEDYGLDLEIVGDTTKFMLKNEDGTFSEDRGSREVWATVYRYAIDKLSGQLSKDALAHNPGFQAASFDYYVANKVFVYNRIFAAEATEEERKIEETILGLTKPNTPVLGVWYLQADEGSFAPMVTNSYKFMVVTYESFNLSWTSGLPEESFIVEEKKLELDPTKKYVSFNFTEGDNNSYLMMRLPIQYMSKARGEYPVGWAVATSTWDLNPNIIRYLRTTWADGDGLVMPEGYVYFTPPVESRDGFFALSDQYFKRAGSGAMRMLMPDPVNPLPYAEKMTYLESLHLGYLDTGNDNYNNDLSHFLFRDIPVFVHYNGTHAASLIKAEGSTPGFYSVTLLGWNADPSTVSTIMNELGDEFVAVTPRQLTQLYKDYYEQEFKQVVQADFAGGMTRSEMGFLYSSNAYNNISKLDGTRGADGNEYFTYKFDLASGVDTARFDLQLSGNYQIEVSTDEKTWYVVARDRYEEKRHLSIDVSPLLSPGKPLFVRFGDASPDNSNGALLYHLQLTTNLSAYTQFEIDGSRDEAWLSPDQPAESGSSPKQVVYRIPLAAGFQEGDLVIASDSPVTASISTDRQSFSALPLTKINNSYYGQLKGVSGTIDLKLESDQKVSFVKLSPTPQPVKEHSFSPVSNNHTRQYLISLDASKTLETGYTSNREVRDGNAMVYRFVTAADVTEAKLALNISGLYRIAASNDGANYTDLFKVAEGEVVSQNIEVDITPFAAGGKTVYVKFDGSTTLADKPVKLNNLRLLTNATSAALLQKVENEREPTIVIAAGSDKELALLDESKSKGHFLYENQARAMNSDPDAQFVYKFEVQGTKLTETLGLEPAQLSKLALSLYIGNAYKLSVSTDGNNWTEITDTDDDTIQSASNLRDLKVPLTPYLGGQAVYVKVSRSSSYTAGRTHDGLVWNIKLTIN